MENPQKTLDNMIQFGSYINTNFKHFPVRALEGIQNFFGYNTMVYTIPVSYTHLTLPTKLEL